MKYTLVILILTVIVFSVQAQKTCGENEVYKECAQPERCDVTCANKDNPPKICPAMCAMRCTCIEGYMKNAEGKCVKSEDC